ncbi:MAG TPA: hypothetical protein VM925_24955 [Labilithrix sp.]|jgi:hypothetical protein|nr:hypothetical protein [Labilithrix sp.]
MGSFFTNVQICLNEADSARARVRVLDALRVFADRAGLVPATKNDESDRTMLVRIGGPWVSIYDSLSEGQNLEVSDALGKSLSRELSAPVATVLVHDSDVLELRLFQDGKLLDRFNNAPSYFGQATPAEITAAKGRPTRWHKVLGDSVDIDELREAFESADTDEPFAAHVVLENIASALGLAHEHVFVGYRYATEPSTAERSPGVRTTGFVELRWRDRSADKPKTIARTVPSFSKGFSSGRLALRVDSAQPFSGAVRNEGAASKGISVVISGPALDEELVNLESLTVAAGVPAYEGTGVPLERWNDAKGHPSFIATLPDVKIPEGISTQALGALARSPDKYVQASTRATIHLTLVCRGLKPGRSRFSIAVVPEANPEGEIVHEVPVNVDAVSRKL